MSRPTPDRPEQTQPERSVRVIAGTLGLLSCGVALVFFCLQQIGNVDFWWQWKTGELILRDGLPSVEPFMFSRAGLERIETAWGYCVALYTLTESLGPALVVTIKLLLVLGTFALAASIARRRASSWALTLTLFLGVVASSQRFEVRPEVVSYAFFALYLFLIDLDRRGTFSRSTYAIPLLHVLWTNVHSLSGVGLVTIAIWAADECLGTMWSWARRQPSDAERHARARRSVLVLVGAGVGSLLNPYGVRLALVPFEQFAALHAHRPTLTLSVLAGLGVCTALTLLAVRWRSGPRADRPRTRGDTHGARRHVAWVVPLLLVAGGSGLLLSDDARGLVARVLSLSSNVGSPEQRFITELRSPFELPGDQDAIIAFKILLVLSVLGVVVNMRRQSLFWIALAVGVLYLSVTAVRNIPLFALVAIPWTATNLSAPFGRSRMVRRVLTPVVAFASVLVTAFYAWDLATNRYYVRQGDSGRFGATLDADAYPIEASAFLERFEFDRMLNAQDQGSYLLARGLPVFIDSRGVGGILDEYAPLIHEPTAEAVRHVLDRYDLPVVVLSTEMVGAFAAMHGFEDWRLVHLDPNAGVYFRRDMAPGVPMLDLEAESDAWIGHVRGTLPELADEERRGLFETRADPNRYRRLARVCFVLGAFDLSRALYEDARAAAPRRFVDLDPLAYSYEATGSPGLASELYERMSLAGDGSGEYRYLAARAALEAGQSRRVIALLEPIGPDAAARDAHLYGSALLRDGQAADAIEWLELASRTDPTVPVHHANLGTALLVHGDAQRATLPLRRAYAMNPDDLSVVVDLALALEQSGRADEAGLLVEREVRRHPHDEDLRALRERLRAGRRGR